MTIARADTQLPDWLLSDYKNIYEQSLSQVAEQKFDSVSVDPVAPSAELPRPDFGVFHQRYKSFLVIACS